MEHTMSPVILALRKQIFDANEAVKAYQDDCDHNQYVVVRLPRSDAGEYDRRTKASYWYQCTCPNCDKYWEEPQ